MAVNKGLMELFCNYMEKRFLKHKRRELSSCISVMDAPGFVLLYNKDG